MKDHFLLNFHSSSPVAASKDPPKQKFIEEKLTKKVPLQQTTVDDALKTAAYDVKL
jgi:hypothetical protein